MVNRINFIILVVIIATILISLNIVSAASYTPPIVNFSSGINMMNISEDVSYIFNISVNNIDPSENIFVLNVSIDGNFIFKAASNGTDAPWESFANTSSVLGWTNISGLIRNNSTNYFWFNATAYTPGTYDIIITTTSPAGPESTNLSVIVFDITPPVNITINSPLNQTYNTNSIIFNIAADDEVNVSSCWYTLNNGVKNYTAMAHIGNVWNDTNSSMKQGGINVRFFCNDTTGNINNSGNLNVSIFIDSIYPAISMATPSNATYSPNVNLSINFTYTEANPTNCWWNDNNGANNPIPCGNISNVTWSEGAHVVRIYMNDTANNINYTQVSFTIDSIQPTITIYNPVNNSVFYINQSILLIFNSSEVGTILYKHTNTTNASRMTSNFTFSTPVSINYTSASTAGRYNITIFANDSANNIKTEVIFFNVTAQDTSTTYIANDTSYNVSAGITNLVVPYNSTIQTVTLTNTTQPIKLDLSQLLNNGIVTVGGNNFSLITIGSSYNYTAFIPSGTNVSGSSWDGKITLPNINSSSNFTAPSNGTTYAVVDFGSSSVEISFSQPVKIVIGGMAGKSAAWTRGNLTLNNIPTQCNSGNSANGTVPTNIDSVTTRECFINDGADLVIWTYHFTTFAAYLPAATSISPTGGSGSGGSGVSFWVNTQSVTAAKFEEGYTVSLAKKYRLQVMIDKKFHYIGIVDITSKTATINVSSRSYQQVFNIGDENKFDLTEDGYYDVSVILNSIINSKANITIKKINESIKISPSTAPATNTTPAAGTAPAANNTTTPVGNKKGSNIFYGIIGVIVVIAVIVIIFFMSKRNKKRTYERIKVYDF